MATEIVYAPNDIMHNWTRYNVLTNKFTSDVDMVIIRTPMNEYVSAHIMDMVILKINTLKIWYVENYVYICIDAKYIPELLEAIYRHYDVDMANVIDNIDKHPDVRDIIKSYANLRYLENMPALINDDEYVNMTMNRIEAYGSVVELVTENETRMMKNIIHARKIITSDTRNNSEISFEDMFQVSFKIKVAPKDMQKMLFMCASKNLPVVYFKEHKDKLYSTLVVKTTVKAYEEIIFNVLYDNDKTHRNDDKMKMMVKQIDQILTIFHLRG